jgi:hypothetical protein
MQLKDFRKGSPVYPLPNSISISRYYSSKVHFNIIIQSASMLGILSSLFLSYFQIEISYTFLIFFMRDMCHAHLITHNLVALKHVIRRSSHDGSPYVISLTSCYFLHFRSKYVYCPKHIFLQRS